MNPSTGVWTMRKMLECSVRFCMDSLHRMGTRQILLVSLTYAVTAVQSDGRSGSACTLHLPTFFPFVDLFQFKLC